jgi:hypothetical protein
MPATVHAFPSARFAVLPDAAPVSIVALAASLPLDAVRDLGRMASRRALGGDLACVSVDLAALVPAHGVDVTARRTGLPVAFVAAWANGAGLATDSGQGAP